MKIVFAGPTLARHREKLPGGVTIRPPAANGDIFDAVKEGAAAIGLIDGVYENIAASWHKEILEALAAGVAVFGGGSIGALRAAECAPFGMVGVGAIYGAYANGELVDDGDVAVLHGPPEMHFTPISEPLVNVRWTLQKLRRQELISDDEWNALSVAASRIFFKDRSWKRIVVATGLEECRRRDILSLISEYYVDIKALDGALVLEAVALADDHREYTSRHWKLHNTTLLAEWLRSR